MFLGGENAMDMPNIETRKDISKFVRSIDD